MGTYFDYFVEKWEKGPRKSFIDIIAEIISYNIFQMDGLTGHLPLITIDATDPDPQPLTVGFDMVDEESRDFVIKQELIPVWIKNWKKNRMEPFE
mgnify:CR=1 FL=1